MRTTVVAPATAERSSAENVIAQADDDDYWCEIGGECHRRINDYVSETEGRVVFGNRSGALGSYDALIRTNLNGAQPQWRVSVIHQWGRSVYVNWLNLNCREDNFLRDSNCGVYRALTGVRITSRFDRKDSGWIYGNRLNDDNEYYAFTSGVYTPSRGPAMTMPKVRTESYKCDWVEDDDDRRLQCIFPAAKE